MARPKRKGSTRSFAGLGLKPSEDKMLVEILKKKELTYRKVAKILIKAWIEEHKS